MRGKPTVGSASFGTFLSDRISAGSRSEENREVLQCCHIDLCYEILDQNRPVCWSIVVRGKPTVGSASFGTFLSDRISAGSRSEENRGVLQCCHIDLCYEILDQNRPVCWSIVVKGKPTVSSHLLGCFFLTAYPRRRGMGICICSFTALPSRMKSE